MTDFPLRRIAYISEASSPISEEIVNDILTRSRQNNGMDGVSGFLWSDGHSFAQILEGPPESVRAAIDRIVSDTRHQNVVILSDEAVNGALFGDWTMAHGHAAKLPAFLSDRFDRLREKNEPSLNRFLDHIGATLER